jgi:transposase-like protein
MSLHLSRDLERTLSTTNAIENLMSSIRAIAGRVKRWQDGAMIERWTGAALIEASKKFRRLRGCMGIKKLVDVLRKRDRSHDTNEVDSNERAA